MKLIIRSEHVRLLHTGPTLTSSSLSRNFHIIGQRKAICIITRSCVTCLQNTTKPRAPIMGQLPLERVTPGIVFEKVGVDYAGPMYRRIRKPTIVKAYVCVFVALSVKAVHLELVSDQTSDAFIACLRRFISRHGKPSCIWSDHGSNFVGADWELSEMVEFLKQQKANVTSAQPRALPGVSSPNLGVCCQEHEDSFETDSGYCKALIRRTFHYSCPRGSLPKFETACSTTQRRRRH